MLQGVQDAVKSNDIGALEKAIEAANKAGLSADEVVKAGVTHLAFLNEERHLVEELTRVRVRPSARAPTVPPLQHAWVCVWLCVWLWVWLCVLLCVWLCVCVCVCVYVYVYVMRLFHPVHVARCCSCRCWRARVCDGKALVHV